MKKSRNRAQRRALQIALIAGAAGMCFATAASADSQAAKKLGQMGVINQTLQPKPVRPPPTANAPAPNAPTTNPNYNANSTYKPNTANNANAVNPGAAAAAGGGQKK
jgi:hypothetical protein